MTGEQMSNCRFLVKTQEQAQLVFLEETLSDSSMSSEACPKILKMIYSSQPFTHGKTVLLFHLTLSLYASKLQIILY